MVGNYIKGGSQVLSDQLVERIRDAGGDALAGQTVVEILLGGEGEVSGVRYQPRRGGNDAFAQTPVIFTNASPHVIEQMLPPTQREAFMSPYQGKPLSTSLFSINLGLKQRPSELGVSAYSTSFIPEWMKHLNDYKHCAELLGDMPGAQLPAFITVDYSQIDSGLVDDDGGLFPVSVVGVDQLTNWERLSDKDYHIVKNAWLAAFIERLEEEWPGFANTVVQKDMATARTMHNYLNTPGGAVYGFAPDVPEKLPLLGPPRTPKTSIKGLWLASAYAGFGGFSGAMGAGSEAVKAALREYRG
jgi:phytoene dehydrogenase-like protein